LRYAAGTANSFSLEKMHRARQRVYPLRSRISFFAIMVCPNWAKKGKMEL